MCFEICQQNSMSRLWTSGPGHRREEPTRSLLTALQPFPGNLSQQAEAGRQREGTRLGVSRRQHQNDNLQERTRTWAPGDPTLAPVSSVTLSKLPLHPGVHLPFCNMMGLDQNRTLWFRDHSHSVPAYQAVELPKQRAH